MSDEDINRVIAEALEPEPTWKKGYIALGGSRYLSDGGYWIDTREGHEPRDCEDPYVTIMLLEELAKRKKHPVLEPSHDSNPDCNWRFRLHYPMNNYYGKTGPAAVAQAMAAVLRKEKA